MPSDSNRRIGIIGAGVMGRALSHGLINAGVADPESLLVSDIHEAHLRQIHGSAGVRTTHTNADVAHESDVILLCVKPQTLPRVLEDIGAVMKPEQLLISIVAGARIEVIESAMQAEIPVIRAMPNTAAQVNRGACAYCRGTHALDEHAALTEEVFRSVGTAIEVEERMMDAVTALSGSGPAYVFLLIEAMVDGGVKVGLPRDLAHQLAAQTVLGAATMVIETGRHPAELKDMVATPSGTTINALAALEHAGFRAALIDAVERAATRSAELGQ